MGTIAKNRILFLNSVCYGSTGKICKDLYDLATSRGYECCIAYGRGEGADGYHCYGFGSDFSVKMHGVITRIFDRHGESSRKCTMKLLHFLDEFKPSIIHLHNIHGYYVNVKMLFEYLKKHEDIKVVWTLHDCWSYTGHCAYYYHFQCEQWKDGCKKCTHKHAYPTSILSNANKNYEMKKSLFLGLKHMTLVTPSEWLKQDVEQSFLQAYSVKVINNGINTDVFTYTESDLREQYHIQNKTIILGVANVWNSTKGFDTYLELEQKLDHSRYQMVMIGLSKQQISELPNTIIGIERTKSAKELAQWYSVADVLFNPTKEDNYPTVDLEAQACGCVVLAYDHGGTKETLYSSSKCVKDIDDFLHHLQDIDCLKKKFHITSYDLDYRKRFLEYIDLYDQLVNNI